MSTISRIASWFGHTIHRLLFTRSDDMDLLQVLFVALIGVAAYRASGLLDPAFLATLDPATASAVIAQTWGALRFIAAFMFVAAVPSWLVPAVIAFFNTRALANAAKMPEGYDTDERDEDQRAEG